MLSSDIRVDVVEKEAHATATHRSSGHPLARDGVFHQPRARQTASLTNNHPPTARSALNLLRHPQTQTFEATSTIMAAAIKALNAKIRANPVTDYFWSVRA